MASGVCVECGTATNGYDLCDKHVQESNDYYDAVESDA